MGNICCKDSTSVIENTNSEIAHLLQNDHLDSNHVEPQGHNVRDTHSREEDYRNLTVNILKETENQMVNANLTDNSGLDIAEIEERTRFYQNKTKFTGKNLPYTQLIPKATGNPNVILSRISLTSSDINLIRGIANKNANALNQILEPDTEELIVNFVAI